MKFSLKSFSSSVKPANPPHEVEMKSYASEAESAAQPVSQSTAERTPPSKKQRGGVRFFPQIHNLFARKEMDPALAETLSKLTVKGMETDGLRGTEIDLTGKHATTAGQAVTILKVGAQFSRLELSLLSSDIETMTILLQKKKDASGMPDFQNHLKDKFTAEAKKFSNTYSRFFLTCDFTKPQVAEHFEGLRNALDADIKKQLSSAKSASTSVRRTAAMKSEPFAMDEEAQMDWVKVESLKQAFRDALKSEKVKAEPEPQASLKTGKRLESHDYSIQMIGARAKQMPVSLEKYGVLMRNQGGGDCLLNALMGIVAMPVKQSMGMRERLAAEIVKSDMAPGYCANLLVAGITQTPEFASLAPVYMEGRHEVSKELYAAFIKIPGTYLGPAELALLTRLNEFKDKEILVADVDGSLSSYKNGEKVDGITPVEFDRKATSQAQEIIILQKSELHWEWLRPAQS